MPSRVASSRRADPVPPATGARARAWLIRLLFSGLSGAMLFTATATWDIWPLAWIAFVPLLWALRGTSVRFAFTCGWTAGLVTNLGGFYWIPHLLMRFGQISRPLALFLFLLLALYQGLHFGVFAGLLRLTKQHLPRLPITLVAPLYFVSLELVTPFIFPWYIAITQAWVLPVIQVADLAGPLGVSCLLVLSAAAVYELVEALARKEPLPRLSTAAALVVIGAALAYGVVRIRQVQERRQRAEAIDVGIVQANIGIDRKGSPEHRLRHHQIHLEESWKLQQAGADLLVWPESSYPFWFDRAQTRDYPPGDPRRVMQRIDVPLIFGAASFGRGEPYPYNSAFMLAPDGRILGRFDKNFLLVFGEYIPFYEQFPSFRKWFPAASHFARGTTVTTFPLGPHRVGPLICYEDIIPAFGRRLAPLAPNLLVNITNDAWFGRTAEPYEHLALAVFRSVELRLDLVRAVNTGVSALIDATGRVYAQTASHDPVVEPGVKPERLLGQAKLLPPPDTVYARWGNVFGYSCAGASLLLLALSAARRLKRRSSSPSARSDRARARRR